MAIPFWVAQLLGSIATSTLSNASKSGAKKAIENAIKKGGGFDSVLKSKSVRSLINSLPAGAISGLPNLGQGASGFRSYASAIDAPSRIESAGRLLRSSPAGNAVGNAGSLVPVGTDVVGMLSGLGQAGGNQFLDSAMLLFLQRYVLPQMLGGGVFSSDGTFNPLELAAAIKRQAEGRKTVEWAFENRDKLGSYPWLRAVRPEASPPIVSRMFGWGGRDAGGWNVDDLLNRIYDDPFGYWEKQVASGAPKAIGADPFVEKNAEMDWRRAQRRKDAEYDWKTKKKLDEDVQDWIDAKLDKYYRKPKIQWAKEKLPELAGTVIGMAGEGFDLYNSILANALMQSAAGRVTPLQEELYGNPYKVGAALYGGGRMAAGKVMDSVGKNIGSFLRDWSDDVRAEFERQRIMRLQMDRPQTGRVIETLGDMRASDTRYRNNWNGRNERSRYT